MVDLGNKNSNINNVKGIFEGSSIRGGLEVQCPGKVVEIRRNHSLMEVVASRVLETLTNGSSSEVNTFFDQELGKAVRGIEEVKLGERLGSLTGRSEDAAAAFDCDGHLAYITQYDSFGWTRTAIYAGVMINALSSATAIRREIVDACVCVSVVRSVYLNMSTFCARAVHEQNRSMCNQTLPPRFLSCASPSAPPCVSTVG